MHDGARQGVPDAGRDVRYLMAAALGVGRDRLILVERDELPAWGTPVVYEGEEGAEVVLTPHEHGVNGAIEKANEIIATTDNAVMPWQFGNPANPEILSKKTFNRTLY